jgi:hypothetical protein
MTEESVQSAETATGPKSNPSSYYRAGEIVFILAALTRLAMFQFPSVTETLGSRVEVVTPITSFQRRGYKLLNSVAVASLLKGVSCTDANRHWFTPVTEGVYLFQNGVPPYDGGVFHQVNTRLLAFSCFILFVCCCFFFLQHSRLSNYLLNAT